MTMSTDRVTFDIHASMWSKGPKAYRQLLRDCFGIDEGDYAPPVCDSPLQLTCRPSQFARFIILRNDAIQLNRLGGVNTIAEMKPRLFETIERRPEPPKRKLDVSRNPR